MEQEDYWNEYEMSVLESSSDKSSSNESDAHLDSEKEEKKPFLEKVTPDTKGKRKAPAQPPVMSLK